MRKNPTSFRLEPEPGLSPGSQTCLDQQETLDGIGKKTRPRGNEGITARKWGAGGTGRAPHPITDPKAGQAQPLSLPARSDPCLGAL